MKRILFFLLGIGLVPLPIFADGGSLSLRQTLEIARSLAPEVVLARHDTSISQADRLKADRYPNPQIDFRVGPNFENLGSGDTDTGLFVGGSFNQEIDLWGKRGLRKKIAEDEIGISKIQELISTRDVEEKIKILYAGIQRGEERVRLIQEGTKTAERFVGTVLVKFQQNQAPYGDVLRAKMELIHRRQDLLHEQSDLKILQQEMNLSLNRSAETPFYAEDPFQTTTEIPALDSLLAKAAARPEFKAIETQMAQQEKEIRLARQEWKPDLNVGIWAEKDAPDTHFGPGFGMALPIFYRNKGEIESAQARKMKTEFQKNYLGRKVEQELRRTYQELQETRQAIHLQRETLRSAGELFRIAFQSYIEGKTDFLRFLETLQTVHQVKSEYYDLLFDYHVRKAQLERAVGEAF
jgi:cobalt-zinc-cadmium efflux system outer membrane protein